MTSANTIILTSSDLSVYCTKYSGATVDACMLYHIPLYLYLHFFIYIVLQFIGIYTILFYYSSSHTHVLTAHIALSDPSNELEGYKSESANSLIKLCVTRWHQSSPLQQNLLVDTNHCCSACLCTECQTPLFNKTLISFRSASGFHSYTPTERHTHMHTLMEFLPAKNEMQDSGFPTWLSCFDSCCKLSSRITDWNCDKCVNTTDGDRFRAESKNRKD